MKKIVIALVIAFTFPVAIFAQDITVDELLEEGDGREITQNNIEEIEQERTENIEDQLNISIPEYTDNPSHIITFRDPSEDEVGVELDIDEGGYNKVTSPYSLPSLSIGSHRLKFRFVDSIGATKVLEYEIVIIPRPPILKAPKFEDSSLVISGTGLANSEILLTASGGSSNKTQIADIDSEGNWTTSMSFEDTPEGIYTVFGYTRKDGYASNPSEPAVMEYGGQEVTEDSKENDNVAFTLDNLSFSDIPSVISTNPDLLIVLVLTLMFGVLITSIFFIFIKSDKEKREVKEISEKMNGSNSKQEKTLMELFGQEEKKEEKPKKVRKKKKAIKKEDLKVKEEKREKVFTRRDFLKDFKKFDPDTDKGKEKDELKTKDKKDIIVTLTSKVEE
jgi:hypothetical protein